MTNGPNASSGKSKWHSKTWWAAVGSIFTAVGVAVAFGEWWFPQQVESKKNDDVPSSSITLTTSTTTQTSGPSMESSSAVTSSSSSSSRTTSSNPSATAAPLDGKSSNDLYPMDLPANKFIKQPSSPKRGIAEMSQKPFEASYSYRFSNCGNCTYDVEFNVPAGYRRFTGTFGLTDETRHDDTIDGVVQFGIYSNGSPLFGPQRAEFPEQVPFDVDITGVTRLRLTVGGGTNAEFPCWCNARFVK